MLGYYVGIGGQTLNLIVVGSIPTLAATNYGTQGTFHADVIHVGEQL